MKSLRAEPAGWAVPAGKKPLAPLAAPAKLEIEMGDILIARSAGQASSVFVLEATKPVRRMPLSWSRYDLATGKALGDPIELWPWIKRDDQQAPPAELGVLAPSVTADGRRLVLRDPAHATWGRVDVWDVEAGRVLGLLPYGGAAVEWHGWAADGRLLTVGAGKLTAWEVPSGRAVFEVAEKYGGRAGLAHDGGWVVVPGVGHLDVIDTATGACLGRLDGGGVSPRAWRRLTVSPDGRRLAGLAWEDRQPGSIHTWDLDSGKVRDAFPTPPLIALSLLWYGERRILAGATVVDLDLHTAVARFELPSPPSQPIEESPDGQLWYVSGVLKPAAFAQGLVQEGPGVLHTGWRRHLLTCPVPDPAVVAELPAAAPAKRAVVFHPGVEVAIDADCGDAARTRQVTAAMEEILKRDGFKIGPGSGWKIVIKAEQYDVRIRLSSSRFTSPVPSVKGSVTLVGPEGTAGGGELHRGVGNTKSKYEKRPNKDGSRNYDFQGKNAYSAFADEYWEAWAASLDEVKWPRALMQVQGKYTPLPVTVRLDAGP